MKYLIIILILLCAVPCLADEFWIGYAPICRHIEDDSAEHNESNNGVFLSYNNITVGTFNNSHHQRSWFAGYTFRTDKWELRSSSFKNLRMFGRANLHVGALYGYGEYMPNIDGWTIGVVPTLELGYKQFSVETMVMPVDGGVIAWMFKYTWGIK